MEKKEIEVKTLKECQSEVARKHGLGNSLVTGHKVAYFDEASEMYADQFKPSWIACSERWPDVDEQVLFIKESGYTWTDIMDEDDDIKEYQEKRKPTHWQYIIEPTPPAGQ